MKKCCCLLLLIGLSQVVFIPLLRAQNLPITFDRFSLEQGMPQSTAMCILQDRQGFVWVGTQEGLCRFDGNTFVVFKNDPDDPASLSSNLVKSICEDKEGNLWMGTFSGGLNRYDRRTQRFTRYLHQPDNPQSLSHNRVEAVYEDRQGTLWIGTQAGLNQLDKKTGQFIRYSLSSADSGSPGDNRVMSLYEDRKGNFWVGSYGKGINLFDRKQKRFSRFLPEPESKGQPGSATIRCMLEDRDGRLWLGTDGGLYQMDRRTNAFSRFGHDPFNAQSLSSDAVWALFEDRTGTFWVGTKAGGLNIMDRSRGTFRRLSHLPTDNRSLSSNQIYCVYEDRTGGIWVGTDGGGISRYDRLKNQFSHYFHQADQPGSLSHNIVWSIYEDRNDNLWIGTLYGLNRYNRQSGQFQHFFHEPANTNSLSFNSISSICEDQTGVMWFGTDGGGLNRYDPASGQFTRFAHDPADSKSLGSNGVNLVLEDRLGNLWIGTSDKGLNRFDRQQNRFIRYEHNPDDVNSMSDNHVMALCEDREGTLWIGTLGKGLNALNPKTGRFTHYEHVPGQTTSLSSNRVIAVTEDQAGIIWVGTAGGGLNRLDRATGKFSHFTEKNGLANNVVYGILDDKAGHLWMSTNQGISRLNPKEGTFTNFDAQNGLQSNEFNNWAFFKSRSGELFFGGINGVNAFHPERIVTNPSIPSVVITHFKLKNQAVVIGGKDSPLQTSVTETPEIRLSYQDNMLSFDFAALDFTAPLKNQYAYRLEGLDQDWIRAGTQHSATYTNLAPGSYVFRVKGSNNDGRWNEEGAQVRVVITPPFWQTWWAYLLYAATALGIGYVIIRNQSNQLQLKNQLRLEQMQAEKFQEVERIKSRFFANISHEFRTPLTLILGPVEKALSEEMPATLRQSMEMVQRNAQRLLRLINQLLDLSKLEAGQMTLAGSKGDLVTYLQNVVASFEPLARQKQVALELTSQVSVLEAYFDRDKLDKICYNLLSNALKFTQAGGSITVTVGQSPADPDRTLEIWVRDTGIGIAAEHLPRLFDRFYQVDSSLARGQEGSGIGLSLVKELVELHGGRIRVNSVPGEGTEFTVTLPVAHPGMRQVAWTDEDSLISVLPEVQTPSELLVDRVISLSEAQADASRPIVLLVEDNPDMRSHIISYLTTDYQVVEAQDGEEGLTKAIELIPDLIISDVMMPRKDGNELSRLLKQDERTCHIPIVLLTAKASRESKISGLETGADDYLMKPFDPKELLLKLKNLLALRQRLMERFKNRTAYKPEESAVRSMDEVFLQRVIGVIEDHIREEEFSVEQLSEEVGLSRTQLHRKLSALTNQSASELIRTVRLTRATELLRKNAATISEIAYAVGFSSLNYFTRCFHQQYGISPSDYKKQAEQMIDKR
jgi:signal transduction histidine kinase/ligand-binding sensor domain-containing protein/DNA-binding response OmpR family regulator